MISFFRFRCPIRRPRGPRSFEENRGTHSDALLGHTVKPKMMRLQEVCCTSVSAFGDLATTVTIVWY